MELLYGSVTVADGAQITLTGSRHLVDQGLPVGPSAVQPAGTTFAASWERVPFETPHALELAEIKAIISDYEQAAVNVKAAGLDGVDCMPPTAT